MLHTPPPPRRTQPVVGDVPHFDVILTQSNADVNAKSFIGQVFNTSWDLTNLKKIEFGGGFTNILIGYCNVLETETLPQRRHDIFLLKIYGHGTEMIIDRRRELQNLNELSKNKMASTLYCTFSNGYCYKYIEGKVCTTEDFKDRNMMKLSAECLARFHSTKLSDEYLREYKMEPCVFSSIYSYLDLVTEDITTEKLNKEIPSKATILAQVHLLEEAISHLNDKSIVFCHNDLNLPNLIHDTKVGVLHCIDFEYASLNYAAYDIANHFNEFAGNDTVDFELLPDKQTQCSWLNLYLEKSVEINGLECSVREKDVEELYVAVSYFSLVSHLLWGIWALVQGKFSHIDFDYIDYAMIRFDQYFACKDDILKLNLS